MSKAEVKASEDMDPTDSSNMDNIEMLKYRLYEEEREKAYAQITYMFSYDKLNRCDYTYWISDESEYQDLKQKYTEKYGEPMEGCYDESTAMWYTLWETDESNITSF